MVMAGAVLGLAVPGIQVLNVATVGKTFPDFTAMWADMLGSASQGRRPPGDAPAEGTHPVPPEPGETRS
jgi:hypothetical protein